MSFYEKYQKPFAEPNRKYAVHQIVHGRVVDLSKVEHYDSLGFAGVVGNVDYQPDFPHNEKMWKDAEAGFREYIARDMQTWIYDEKGYPSGTAGAYVTETYPEYVAQGLYCYDYWRPLNGPSKFRADVPDGKLWKALLVPTKGGAIVDVTSSLDEKNVLRIDVPTGEYYLYMMVARRLFDGTHATESWCEPRNYISLSDKKAAEAFIECTHENYKKHLGDEFGKGIVAMFTDEPSLISWNIRATVFPMLPWLESYPADFKAKYGYEFYEACVAVVLRMGEQAARRRCDFWEFIGDTVAENYFGTIQDWCHKNGIKSSGHLLEEQELQAHVYCYGSFYRSMKRFDWPGIDQLDSTPGWLMYEGYIPIGRLAASVADISGEREAFTEFSHINQRARNEEVGKDDYYYSANWHFAQGINNFTSYYPWTQLNDDEIRQYNKYIARGGYMLREGVRDSRVAIFYPEAAMWEAYHPRANAERAIDPSPYMVTVAEAFKATSWAVLNRQMDFDYIDSELLQNGEIRDGKLCYRDRAYSVVALPCARVLEDANAQKLAALATAGIKVLFAGEMPNLSRETGERSRFADALQSAVDAGRMWFAKNEEFGALLDQVVPEADRIVNITPADRMVQAHCRITEDGTRVVFLCNMGSDTWQGTVQVNGAWKSACVANPVNGEIAEVALAKSAGGVAIDTAIPPHEGRFFLLK